MGRVEALAAAGGFDARIPAGEEADLCMRVHARGFTVVHLDAAMGTHDIGDLRLRSWWMRCVRTGYAYAQAYGAHRYRREARSALAWGLVLPALVLGTAWISRGASLLLLLAIPAHMFRIHRWARKRGWTARESVAYAVFTMLAKLPEAAGILAYALDRLRGVQPRLVRYR
jgi:GT2 family glycosyltransferase